METGTRDQRNGQSRFFRARNNECHPRRHNHTGKSFVFDEKKNFAFHTPIMQKANHKNLRHVCLRAWVYIRCVFLFFLFILFLTSMLKISLMKNVRQKKIWNKKSSPFVMMHEEKNYTGNSRFYGFCVDLLDVLGREVGFSYTMEVTPDQKYGAKDPKTGKWNGMVQELMTHVGHSLLKIHVFFFCFFFLWVCMWATCREEFSKFLWKKNGFYNFKFRKKL